MERAIQIFAVINLVVIGLSHVAQPRAWAEFFVALREKGDRGVFVVGFMSLAFGSLIVAFHNVWSGLPIVLTILGWTQVLKGLVYFTFPSYGLRKLGIVDVERARMFVWPGLGLLVIAALLGYDLAAGG
ncbi:MAG: hypothetical protein V3W24_02215 [Gemmatimonadota bacterium]